MGAPNAGRPVRLLSQHGADRIDNTLGSYTLIFVVLYMK